MKHRLIYISAINTQTKNDFNITNDITYNIHQTLDTAINYVRESNPEIDIINLTLDDWFTGSVPTSEIATKLNKLSLPITKIGAFVKYAEIQSISTDKIVNNFLQNIAKCRKRDYFKMVARTNEVEFYDMIEDRQTFFYCSSETGFSSLTYFSWDNEFKFSKESLPNTRHIYSIKTFFEEVSLYNELKSLVVIEGQLYRYKGITYEAISVEKTDDHYNNRFVDIDGKPLVALIQRSGLMYSEEGTIMVVPLETVINNFKVVDDL